MTQTSDTPPGEERGKLTGKHVLMAMLLFFGVIISVNVYFVRMALDSFPGEQQKKSYLQGLNYNDVIEAKADQADRGWHVLLRSVPENPSDRPAVEIKIVDKAGEPISDLIVTGAVRRPTTDRAGQDLKFRSLDGGIYLAALEPLDAGGWDLTLEARTEEVALEDLQEAQETVLASLTPPDFVGATRIWVKGE